MKKRQLIFSAIFLTISAGSCLLVLAVIWWIAQMPAWAEKQGYGTPSPGLSQVQRMYLSIKIMQKSNELKIPIDPYGVEQDFEITLGESTDTITQRLESQGLIPSAAAMRDFLIYSGLDTSLQAGAYKLNPRMTTLEIARALQDATPNEVIFHILPGWRMEEIAEALPTSGLQIAPDNFKAAILKPSYDQIKRVGLPIAASLEGFLFPDSYQLPRDISIQALVDIFTQNFSQKVIAELRQGLAQSNLSLYDAVILASIVQREAIIEEEMPQIASVFLNRLRDGIKLDADPTVQYALGYSELIKSWWTVPLNKDDLQVDSPYNTYLFPGLPPGPISNPGITALRAVAFPAQTPYYYFRAACDGSGRHVFSETYEQHVKNACP